MSDRVSVLVVEDSEDQAALLRNYLERAGCHVTVVTNAEDAFAAYAAEPPRLAIIDLVLPGMDGRTLARQLKSDLPDCEVAITSVLDPSEFPEADAILPKPFTGAQVRQIVRDTLQGRSAS